MNRSFFDKATAVAIVLWSSTVMCGLAQTATHSCPDYGSPGTLTVSCQFARPVGTTNLELLCVLTLPDGWVVDEAALIGQGGPALDIDGRTILFTGSLTANPLSFSYDVIVPSGQSGPKAIVADFYYRLRGQSMKVIRATPDPLVIDDSLRTLQVISAYGTSTPAVGVYTNLAGTVLNANVSASAYVGTTQYVCTGWTMTGNAPATGTTTNFTMTVSSDAVLTWNWSLFNVAPVITKTVAMYGLRTKTVTMPESKLLASAFDSDGDALSLIAVNPKSALGGTVTWSGGLVSYLPPAGSRLGLADTFTYTVADEHGAQVIGTAQVTVPPAGTAIRIF